MGLGPDSYLLNGRGPFGQFKRGRELTTSLGQSVYRVYWFYTWTNSAGLRILQLGGALQFISKNTAVTGAVVGLAYKNSY